MHLRTRLAILFAGFILPVAAMAARGKPLSITEQLTRGAVIVEADISAMEYSTVEADGDVLPVRLYTLGSVDAGRATVSPRLRLILPGGRIGDLEVVHSDVPDVSVGEHVVFINRVDDSGTLRIVSFANGLFHRMADASGREVVGNEDRRALTLADCTGRPVPVDAETGDSALSWSTFITTLRTCSRS